MSSRLTRDDARALALEVLRGKPDPAVRVRLLRDVLGAESDDPRRREARVALDDSSHVALLCGAQRADGSWGRLHSRDATASGHVPTTEWAVERALALGLEAEHPVLEAATRYLAAIAEGRASPTDPPERNDRWATGVRLFAAATLARIDAAHRAVDGVWELWNEIARRSLACGTYDADAECQAHAALTGARVRGTYLVLSNRYCLALLAARVDRMDPEIRRALALWVRQNPEGIGYLGVPLASPPALTQPGVVERFLQSHEMAARLGAAGAATGPLADWLGGHRRSDGLWDLGPRAAWTPELPLSESWRRGGARAEDWTARALVLLMRWLA